MRHYFLAFLISLTFFGCNTKEEESVIDENRKKNVDKVVQLESLNPEDSLYQDKQTIKDSFSDAKPFTHKENDDSQKKQIKKNSPPPIIAEELDYAPEERKEPLIIQSIEWSKKEMILTYKKTVYPKPDVGCSSSDESLVLRVPISKPKGEIILNNTQLRNSTLSYNYSGGLYGKYSLNSPPSGQIVLSPQDLGKWKVDIDIKFRIDEIGGQDQQSRDEEFKLSGVFN